MRVLKLLLFFGILCGSVFWAMLERTQRNQFENYSPSFQQQEFDEIGVPTDVIELVYSEVPENRNRGVNRLSEINSLKTIPYWLTLLTDPDRFVKLNAIEKVIHNQNQKMKDALYQELLMHYQKTVLFREEDPNLFYLRVSLLRDVELQKNELQGYFLKQSQHDDQYRNEKFLVLMKISSQLAEAHRILEEKVSQGLTDVSTANLIRYYINNPSKKESWFMRFYEKAMNLSSVDVRLAILETLSFYCPKNRIEFMIKHLDDQIDESLLKQAVFQSAFHQDERLKAALNTLKIKLEKNKPHLIQAWDIHRRMNHYNNVCDPVSVQESLEK